MKKLFNKIYAFFYKVKRKVIAWWENILYLNYKKLRRRKSFIHSVNVIPVKKGDIKYSLIIVETSFGKMIWNIGRHDVNDLKTVYTSINGV